MGYLSQADRIINAIHKKNDDVVLNKTNLLGLGLFNVIGPEGTPGGTRITTKIRYSVTDNTRAATAFGAMADPNDARFVDAYWTKVYRENSVLVSGIQQQQMGGSPSGTGGEELPSEVQAEINQNVVELYQNLQAAMLAQLVADVDAASTFSDAALTRSTYNMATYEEDTGAAVTKAYLEGAIDALLGPSYGPNVSGPEQLAILCPPNQYRRIANVLFGIANRPLNQSPDAGGLDGGLLGKPLSMDGIPIVSVTGMSTTDILVVHRPSIEIYFHAPLAVEDKTAGHLGDGSLFRIWAGMNLVVRNPMDHAKLSAKTA